MNGQPSLVRERQLTVDVIIPVFNGERFLEDAANSVLMQSFPANRIIIVDDGSDDSTPQIAQRLAATDQRITYIRSTNMGVSAARNLGIKASTANLIAFLDSDDLWRSDKLERQMHVLSQADRNVGFVHSSYFFIDEHGDRLSSQHIEQPRQRGDIFLPLLHGYSLSGSASSVMVYREVLDKAGYFDEQLFFGEDWDLWIRLGRVSWVDFTPEAVVGIRVHHQSSTRRPQPGRAWKFFGQKLQVYSKWQDILTTEERFRSILRKDAIEAVLPFWRNPLELWRFYRRLVAGDIPLGSSIFRNILDFSFTVSLRLASIFWKRLRRKVRPDG